MHQACWCIVVLLLGVLYGKIRHLQVPCYSMFVSEAQALLLSGRHTGLYNYIYTKVGKLSLLLSMCPDGNRESYDK